MRNKTIPQPLVRTNQWFIVISVLISWFTQLEWILAIPLAAGLMGLFFGFNPVMRLAKVFLKKAPSEYIPEDWDQQQFNQTIAVVCLGGGLACFLFNWYIAAYIFTAMVALAAGIALMGFCIGCFIRYQWKQYQYRNSLK
ncbi:DUF4395 domain-containing protein [Neobacillus sp. PS3-34]|uniref:DUF4395 domain-containing protein n=1 Tax=Neobacillus sp. PS3-34 TaxID=3070678 RepID=UPI0027DF40CD|nr:DUF4395 domain-containing protein [Neobacillus sp. PS3-34]WML48113.1 DUF4395 domain-containing protein [Neobacillus sp. PS3-34]